MLRLIKRHKPTCKTTSTTEYKCVSKEPGKKVLCPFTIYGPDPRFPGTGKKYKEATKTADERIAREKLYKTEQRLHHPEAAQQPVSSQKSKTLDQAIEHFLATKTRTSDSRQRKLKRLLCEMANYLKTTQHRVTVRDAEKTDLEAFMNTWKGEYTTLKTARENMMGFWGYCFDSGFTDRNISKRLPTFRREKQRKIPTFTPDEAEAIIRTAKQATEDGKLFGRGGEDVALKVLAFTLVEKYTGMAIGDVAKLRIDELHGTTIQVNRKKTGEPVFTTVPGFVATALHAFEPDSAEYFFWSGKGKHHTRTTKWGERLQKLYAAAGVRVVEEMKTRRSGGKLKDEPELVKVSKATPHWWRHTFVRDCYLQRISVETIADLIGDDVKTVREFYSSFDVLRQEQLKADMASMWDNDPFTQRWSAGLP